MIRGCLYPAVFACAFFSAWLWTRWSLGWAARYNAFEWPGPRKIHAAKIPNLGWMGIFGGWITPLAMLAATVLIAGLGCGARDPYVLGMMRKMPVMAGIIAGGVLSLVVGWIDDRKKISPLGKVAAQAGLACLLCVLGLRITLFASPALGILATVLWVVCVMNAFNLLDNLDGACAGVAAIACGIFFCVAAWLHQYFISLLLAAFMGALGGFLVMNFPPAKVFMGNAGSSFVGYVLSTLTILETFYSRRSPSHLAVIMPALILAVPIYDTASVILIRLATRAPIYRGDMNHFSHRLLRRGLGARQVAGIIYGITLLAGAGSLFLPFVDGAPALAILGASVCLLLALGIWERMNP